MQRISLTLSNTKGLHARAAAKFSNTVADYDCQVKVSYKEQTVDGDSVIQLMLLAAAFGKTLEIEITGRDECAAKKAITLLVESSFGES